MDSTFSLPSTTQTPSLLDIPSSFLSLPSTTPQSAQSSFLTPSLTNLFSANSLTSFLPKFHYNKSNHHYQNPHHHHNPNHNNRNDHTHDGPSNDQCDNVSKSHLSIKLVEPVIFFRGKPEEAVGCILRGDLMLHLSRPTKIRKLQLKFVGKTKTILNDGNYYYYYLLLF